MSQNPILELTFERVAEMTDDDLVVIGELISDELVLYKRAAGMVDGEIIRRAKEREATRLATVDNGAQVFASVQEGKPTYEWDAPKVLELLRPKVTPEELARAVKEKAPPPPPKATFTVHTQSVTALAKRVGLVKEIDKLCKVTHGAPSVKYERHEGKMGDDVEFD